MTAVVRFRTYLCFHIHMKVGLAGRRLGGR
jgi:hypothetical protein